MRVVKAILAGCLVVSFAACGGKGKSEDTAKAAPDNRSLYERLGGTPAITAVVEKFVAVTGSDPRISSFFTNADIPRLKSMMVEHICSITGGPCTYTGKSMKESHAGMGLNDGHFDALVEDLANALDESGVKETEKNELLGALAGMRGDIVEQ